jgi:hypothetical protein
MAHSALLANSTLHRVERRLAENNIGAYLPASLMTLTLSVFMAFQHDYLKCVSPNLETGIGLSLHRVTAAAHPLTGNGRLRLR